MRILFALASDEPGRLEDAMHQLQELANDGDLHLADAAIVNKEGGLYRLPGMPGSHAAKTVGTPALVGGALGAVAGAVVAQPVVGGILGALIAGAGAAVREPGLEERFIKRVSEAREGDEAVLLVDVEDVDDAEVLAPVVSQPASLLYSNAPFALGDVSAQMGGA